MARDIDAILASAVETLLWSETISIDHQDPWGEDVRDGDPFDDHFGPEDLSPETIAELRSDIEGFLDLPEVSVALDAAGMSDPEIGHNLILTRNRHGAGFWARGLGEPGRVLTTWAHSFGTFGLMLGDDGRIYHHD